MAQAKLTEKERAAVRAEAAATDWKSNKKASAPKQESAPQQQPEDTIVPRGNHPPEAVYVARDKKSGAEVSFDQWGRKLDSLGHVVAGDRQRAGDAGAKEIYRPPAPQPKPEAKSPSEWTTGPSGPMSRVPQRSSWDNSVLPSTTPAAPSARAVPPGVLAPGGVDPATGQKVPTAFNGMLPSAPQQAQQQAPQEGPQPWRPAWDIKPLQSFMSGLIPMETAGLGTSYRIPEPATGPVYEPLTGVTEPVTDPLAIYRQGVDPTWPAEPVGPQNYNRNLDVRDYMPGGRYYTGKY
jgi:hypothetical protein